MFAAKITNGVVLGIASIDQDSALREGWQAITDDLYKAIRGKELGGTLDGRGGYVPPAPLPPVLSRSNFIRLFTPAQILTLHGLRDVDNDIKYWWILAEAGNTVDLGHPDTATGLSLLVAKGLISAADRTRILEGRRP